MKPRNVVGVVAVVLLCTWGLTGFLPAGIAGGLLLTCAAGNANRATLRHHAHEAARDTEGPRP